MLFVFLMYDIPENKNASEIKIIKENIRNNFWSVNPDASQTLYCDCKISKGNISLLSDGRRAPKQKAPSLDLPPQ